MTSLARALCLVSLIPTILHAQSYPGGLVPRGAQKELEPWQDVGDMTTLENWRGLRVEDGGAVLSLPGVATYTYEHGRDWSGAYGLRLDLDVPEGGTFEGHVRLSTPQHAAKSSYRTTAPVFTTAALNIVGSGKTIVDLPFAAFDHFYPYAETFRAIKKVSLTGKFQGAKPGELKIARVRVIQAPLLKLYSGSRSRVADSGEAVAYELKVMNCSDRLQSVVLAHHPYSKHVLSATLTPDRFSLDPGETKTCRATIVVSDRIPPGGRERQRITATANGSLGGQIEFITGCKLPHPYLVHTPERWQAIREKIKNQEWALQAMERYVDHKPRDKRPGSCWPSAVAWQLTRDKELARLAKPGVRADVGGKDLIQAAEIYDMIVDSGVFSEDEQEKIEEQFRERMHHVSLSGVANLELQEARCGFTLALAVQDFAWFDYFLYASDGVYDNIANGIMPDGWWYEGSVNYNIWVSRYICKMALAAEPFGINLIDHYFTPGYSKEFRRLTDDVETRKREFGGKPFQKFGKHPKPRITLDMLWDSFADHIAYDGTVFAANDGGEVKFSGGEAFEIAYMMYGKPEYASVIKFSGGRNLLYGADALPEKTPPIGVRSAHSDGIGFVTLRSQTPGRHPREQIAATLKYGTHGAYHGHFDRTNFNSLMRYDRSFYPSGHGLWYSYASFMYGMYVQSSVNHNMVVVDGKNQESVESRRLLFHSGPRLQAAAVETNARWSNPPYLGLQMRRSNSKEGEPPVFSPRERLAAEDVFMPVPESAPEVADIGSFSERVLQRRAMIVTDHYLVLADYLRGSEEHTYDNLLQIRGFQEITGGQVAWRRHTDQMGSNPLLADQLITNCNWYDKNGVTKTSFHTIYDERSSINWRTLHGKKGDLFLDVYSAWPPRSDIMVGIAPELRGRGGWSKYEVFADDDRVAHNEFSPWILGRDDIDVSIAGRKTLRLKMQNEDQRRGGGFVNTKTDGLFWAGGGIVTSTGKMLRFSDLLDQGRVTFDGIRKTGNEGKAYRSGHDYRGGGITIAGRPYQESLPAQPQGNGLITIDLEGLDATRFRTAFGFDYPTGDDVLKYQRNVYGARSKGRSARFLTLIEPFEKESMVVAVHAPSADRLPVELHNGIVEEIEILGLEGDGSEIEVSLFEELNGVRRRVEHSTTGPKIAR